MRTLRRFLVGLFVVAIALLATGSGGFSAMQAERGVDVSVAQDERAFLGIEVADTDGMVGGDTFTLFDLSNNFGQPASVDDVEVVSGPVSVKSASMAGGVTVACTEPGTSARLTITVSGQTIQVVKHKSVPVDCTKPTVRKVLFDGCGNAKVEADDALYPLEVTLVGEKGTGERTTETATVTGPDDPTKGVSGKLVAVKIDGETYENPNQCAQTSGKTTTTTETPTTP